MSGDGWIDIADQEPRSGAIVWAAVVVAGSGHWPVPVVAITSLGLGGDRVWRDARSLKRLNRGAAQVTHWRPLDVPTPPT